jgi:hypothetical protein
MSSLKEKLTEKINWDQVDLVMVGFFFCDLKKGFCINESF